MLYGQRVLLRPWSESDLSVLSAIRNDLEMQLLLMAEPRPNSVVAVREWLQDRSPRDDGVLFVISRSDDDHALGFIQAQRINRQSRYCYLGICIARDHQSKGVGYEALQLLEIYLYGVLGLRKLLLEVLSDNKTAISFYERAGFARAGTLSSHHRIRDHFVDVVIMEKMLCRGDSA